MEDSLQAEHAVNNLSCPKCHKMFKLRIELKVHMKTCQATAAVVQSVLSGEKEEDATLPKPSPRKIAKGNQKATHKDKPFECDKCRPSLFFARRDDQIEHVKQVHGLSDAEITDWVSREMVSAAQQSNSRRCFSRKNSNVSLPRTPSKNQQQGAMEKFVTVKCLYCNKDIQRAGKDSHIRECHSQYDPIGPSTPAVPPSSASGDAYSTTRPLPTVFKTGNLRDRRSSSVSNCASSASDKGSTDTVSTNEAKGFKLVLKDPKKVARKKRSVPETIECTDCGKIFVYRARYERHILEKHSELPATSSDPIPSSSKEAKKKITSPGRKVEKSRVRRKSEPKNEFPCFCGGKFRDKNARLEHVIHAHNMSKEKAEECIEKLVESPNVKTTSSPRKHVKKPPTETRVDYNVPVPPNYVPLPGAAPARLYLVQNSGFMPLIPQSPGSGFIKEERDDHNIRCSKCGIRFNMESKLREHEKEAHTTKHECPYCYKVYFKQAWLASHVENFHSNQL